MLIRWYLGHEIKNLHMLDIHLDQCHLYYPGLDQLCKDAEAMLGFQPGLYWRVCWKFVSPLLISVISSHL